MIYRHIVSTNENSPTILPEAMLSVICNPVTRNMMTSLDWIRQRLCYTDGVLSARQIDILSSIKSPLIKADSSSGLNFDIAKIKPRPSHPLSRDISDLIKTKKDLYITYRMNGSTIIGAYEEARDFVAIKK